MFGSWMILGMTLKFGVPEHAFDALRVHFKSHVLVEIYDCNKPNRMDINLNYQNDHSNISAVLLILLTSNMKILVKTRCNRIDEAAKLNMCTFIICKQRNVVDVSLKQSADYFFHQCFAKTLTLK
jgi:hypothetical protein